eukprot:jgi/Psemu1/306315/fgenesh1_kg.248_\
MIANVNSESPMTSLLLKTSSEYHHTCRHQLGKKRPRSSISEMIDSCSVIKPVRRVQFLESPLPSLLAKHGHHATTYGIVRKSEGVSNDPGGTIDNMNNVWYSKSELAEFTKQARDYVLGLNHKWGTTDPSYCTRGFERYDIARAQQKAMTRKIILLLMQQEALTDEEKSTIAHRSSAWAVEEAFVTGCRDYCEAYHPHLSHLLNNKINNTPTTKAENTTINDEKEGERKRM